VFVELPKPGTQLSLGNPFGVVESVKTVSDLYAPCTGKVVAVNNELEAKPELVNADPYGKGWMVEIEMTTPAEVQNLLKPESYEQRIKEETA
jgi:glycine cleavage system H protein